MVNFILDWWLPLIAGIWVILTTWWGVSLGMIFYDQDMED